MKRCCGWCDKTDGLVYTSNPPKYKCTIDGLYGNCGTGCRHNEIFTQEENKIRFQHFDRIQKQLHNDKYNDDTQDILKKIAAECTVKQQRVFVIGSLKQIDAITRISEVLSREYWVEHVMPRPDWLFAYCVRKAFDEIESADIIVAIAKRDGSFGEGTTYEIEFASRLDKIIIQIESDVFPDDAILKYVNDQCILKKIAADCTTIVKTHDMNYHTVTSENTVTRAIYDIHIEKP